MSYKINSPLPVIEGGTGQITLTSNGVLLGNGTGAIAATIAGTTGQVLTGVTGLPPTFQSPAAASISITGDTGGALSGSSFTFAGGTTGLSFGGSGSTETLTFAGITANGGAVSLGTDNAANAITIGTGTVARNINIGLSAASHVISIGTTNGTASLGLNAGTGDMTLISGDAITLDAAGVLELNSTGGAISVGNDANNFAVNIGTAGTRTVTVGSTTSTSSTAIKSGTGNVVINSGLTIDSTGRNYNTVQPAFLAYLGSVVTNATGNNAQFQLGTTTALTEVFDQGGNFNTNGTFTAPITGRYHLSCRYFSQSETIATSASISIITTARTYILLNERPASNVRFGSSTSDICDMTAGDTAVFKITIAGEAANTVSIYGDSPLYTAVSGFLVC